MPGIFGIIRREPYEGIQRDLSLMGETMRHETYYVGSQYVSREIGVYLGWWSHPCSLGERMPLISRDKRFVLIMVGENYPGHRKSISPGSNGGLDAGAQDLLRLYEDSEDKFIESLNGWFCGVALDLNLQKITLFNDRYGMSRVYFHQGKEEFVFASE